MLEKSKKEKQEKGNKNALKMYTHLVRQKPYSIMLKSFPKINHLNILRAVTNIHVNYVIFSFIEAIQKANMVYQSMNQPQSNYLLENVKIGIIGGGVMSRLILNSLLAFQKEGIVPSNIMISTRQQEDMEFYTSIFKIPVEFNNEKIAELADILIIATPSTLDNWVLLDLKPILQKRITAQPKIINQKPNSKSIKNLETKTEPKKLNPLIYITTSNMTTEKLSKLFTFPILTPFIRGYEEDEINSLVKESQAWLLLQQDLHLQQIQKAICKKVIEKIDLLKETLSFVFQKSFAFQEKNTKVNSMDSGKKSNKTLKISEGKIISSESKSLKDEKPSEKVSQFGQSKKSSISYSTTSNAGMYNIEAARNLIDEVLSTNGSYQQTFLVRSRKWRMAYNNFIA